MQYPHSRGVFDKDLFKNPPSEYRSEPFWAWNNDFDEEELKRQIDVFRRMGFGGFFMHIRPGNRMKYMGEEYINAIGFCIRYAKSVGMLAALYDEDKWPSGYAGGEVTRDRPEYRQRFVRVSKTKNESDVPLAEFNVTFDEDGYIQTYNDGKTGYGTVFFAGVGTFSESGWYGGGTYSDTLSKAAVDLFISLTHERFYKEFGGEFSKTVPSIFTDEPQFEKADKPFTGENAEALIPWTEGMERGFFDEYGYSLTEMIPELVFTKRGYSRVKYDYYRYLLKLFSKAYPENVGEWCERHGLGFTGHFMCEYPIENQVRANAEAMYCYKGFSMPGIDMLIDLHEYITVKQAASVACQYGREGVAGEIYGVTGWQFDFAGYLHQGDWEAALGLTLRVPHLSWLSMESAAKRDFPASINYQAPWYERYPLIEDHFARINTLMTRGKRVCRVAIVHPVESYWLLTGDTPHNRDKIEELNEAIESLTETLLDGNIDFDFISESLLPEQFGGYDGGLNVGEMTYSAVIFPKMITVRTETWKIMSGFSKAGGRVFCVCYPELSDAERPFDLDVSETELLPPDVISALGPERLVDVREGGKHLGGYVYSMKDDGGVLRLFVCPRSKPERTAEYKPKKVSIAVKGRYYPEFYDTFTGDIQPYNYAYTDGYTVTDFKLCPLDSVCLSLHPVPCGTPAPEEREMVYGDCVELDGEYGFTLSEPNVMLLDRCRVTIDGKHICTDEVFRCQSAVEEYRSGHKSDVLSAEFAFESRICCEASLALERAENAKVYLNGEKTDGKINGHYIDRAEKVVALGRLKRGKNLLTVEYDMRGLRTLEPMYLLGDFGVFGDGDDFFIDSMKKKLPFGDITKQGLAFYGANVTYDVGIPACKNFKLAFPSIEGALAEVYDGGPAGTLTGSAFKPPYEVEGAGRADAFKVKIVFYGNRYNTLMPLHNADFKTRWYGPNLWYQKGDRFTYDYMLRPTGFLIPPKLYTAH